jgi:hypothetical protein
MTGLRQLLEIEEIIIHCADTPNGLSRYTIEQIDEWHAAKAHISPRSNYATLGGVWPNVAYHFVIETSGKIEPGRGLDEIGSHTSGRNTQSIGICLIGTDKFTEAQWESLANLVRILQSFLPIQLRVSGHRDHARKYCPGFSVETWYYDNNSNPTADQICEERHI